MTPVAKSEKLENIGKITEALLLGAEVNTAGAKRFFLILSIALYKFALQFLFYSLYKAVKKGGYELEFMDIVETEALKILESRQYGEKEFIALIQALSPPWSKELKQVLKDVATEAIETYEMKKALKSDKALLDSFMSQIENATSNTP